MRSCIKGLSADGENLKSLFAETPEIFCVLSGPRHIFEFVNKAHINAMGFDATGKSIHETQPESIEVIFLLDKVYTTGVAAHLVEFQVTIGQKSRYFDFTFSARRDLEGNINGVMILGSEVTARVLAVKRSATEKLCAEKTERNLKLALQSGNMGLWHHDFITNQVELSESLLQILRIDQTKDDLNKLIDQLIHPEDKDRVRAAWDRAIRYRDYYSTEYRIVLPDGEVRWISTQGNATYNQKGTPLTFAGVTIDITRLKDAEEKLKCALRSKDEFISVASHELKTPLSSLLLQTEMVIRKLAQHDVSELTPEKLLERYNKTQIQVERLIRLVDDMLDLSRIESGRLNYRFQVVDLTQVARDTFSQLKEEYDDRCITLTGHFPEKKIPVLMDRERIEQAITNLLTNALKYGNKQAVDMGLYVEGERAIISVKDHGIGIADENLDKIFNKFERIDKSDRTGGLGIGLFISKEIVDAHKGKISVVSHLGEGSTFRIELPLQSPQA